ncbi:MAG: hypothetical protein LBS73_05325, partial [Campylobacteraceae bacterium]|nr:hypothetical protein [Campylobacteraceae bacterium]
QKQKRYRLKKAQQIHKLPPQKNSSYSICFIIKKYNKVYLLFITPFPPSSRAKQRNKKGGGGKQKKDNEDLIRRR